jgi:8-oxo-dGTP diphosphatase
VSLLARPTCCKQAILCEGIRWVDAVDWSYDYRAQPAGWGMVLDYGAPDTGKAPEPEYGPIAFCPLCGKHPSSLPTGAMMARVGVAVIVHRLALESGLPEILWIQRQGSHGAGTWSFPGGAMDPGETPLATAIRELEEETGIKTTNVTMLNRWVYDASEGDGWITLYAAAYVPHDTVATITEPTKCSQMLWQIPGEDMPAPLFAPVTKMLADQGGAML